MKTSMKVGAILNQEANDIAIPSNMNLKLMVAEILRQELNQSDAELFLQDSNVACLSDESDIPADEHLMQRSVINNFFVSLLFRFRARSEVSIIHKLPYLTIQGRSEDWVALFRTFIVPFIREHDVFSCLRS